MQTHLLDTLPMPDQPLADLEGELEWRRSRNLAVSAERAANEARIARLMQLIGDAREPHERTLGTPTGSPIPLIIVLAGFAIIGLFVGLFRNPGP
jgi:hypothetical protein